MEFLILSILLSNKAIGKFSGMTVSDILDSESLDFKDNTFYKQLKVFNDKGFVGIGAKEGRALTFYITDVGIQRLKEEKENEK